MINTKLFLKDYIELKDLEIRKRKELSRKFDKILSEVKNEIEKNNKTLNILNKKYKLDFKIKDLEKFKKFKKIAIIGMGGSILGSESIFNFFKKKIKKKIYFFNDLDEEKVTNFKKNQNLSKILFIIISKSGNTVETLSNVFSLNIIKKNSRNVILISEKKNNLLYDLSQKLNLFYIEHKNYVGGRYSVLSEVGMIPAYLMGINIFKIREKILDCLNKKNKDNLKNSTINLACLMQSGKFNNLIFLNYSPELKKFLYWCQQLIAESLGKKNKGFLPVISNVPKDHHSLLQLYLDGPKDKIFNIFSYEKKQNETIKLHKSILTNKFLHKKNLSKVKSAQINALKKSFIKNKIPFRDFKIKSINEVILGKLFSLFIIETVIIGRLLNINPYDQPAVEQVKIYTKKYLN